MYLKNLFKDFFDQILKNRIIGISYSLMDLPLKIRSHVLNMYILEEIENPEYLEEPNNDNNHNYDIENVFDFMVHRDIIIDKPEKNTCNN